MKWPWMKEKKRNVLCPDCGEFMGYSGQKSYSCVWCYVKIQLDWVTPDPYTAPMLLTRSIWANRADQVNKLRREYVVQEGSGFRSVQPGPHLPSLYNFPLV
jgi:hypothetical protein